MSRYLAFDIETAKQLPAHVDDLLGHRPLGISCAATIRSGDKEARTWFSQGKDGQPSPSMSRDDVAALVRYLQGQSADGDTIVTWNGVGFDFLILADESGLGAECQRLALGHIDMMFHFFCLKGFPVSLGKAAEGMGVSPKSKSVSGASAPQLWADGKHDEVLKYVSQDAATSLELAEACAAAKGISWVTAKGSIRTAGLSRGWLAVEEARKLPLPDTSWMDRPIIRADLTEWVDHKERGSRRSDA